MAIPERTLTVDGFESQLVCLNGFRIASYLRLLFRAQQSGIHFDDLQLEAPGTYAPGVAYGQSKTATIYMSNEIDRRYGSKGIHSLSLHPGGIWTGLQIHMDTSSLKGNRDVERNMKNCEQGAATTVWAAVEREWEGHGGEHLNNCQIAPSASEIGR